MAAEGPKYVPPSLPSFSSRTCCKVVLLLIVSSFYVNLTSMGVICGNEPYPAAFSSGNNVHGSRYGVRHVIVPRAFSKAKIPYYPNSSATYSTRRIILSGDVELNPGMTNGIGNSTRTGINRKQRSINIAHLNVRSLKNKEHYIQAKDLAKKHKLDIFTISESWLTDSVSDLEVEFPGFSLFRLDRNYKIGGGVCAYVNNSFKCVKFADFSYISDTGLHQLWLKVQVKNFKSFIICTAYRTDDVPVNCFETDLSFTLTSAMTFNVPIFILGDLTFVIYFDPASLNQRQCWTFATALTSHRLSTN